MTRQVSAYNQTQKIQDIGNSQTLTTVGVTATIVYTCPAGKKAKINVISWALIALGTNTFIDLRLAGTITDERTVAGISFTETVSARQVVLTAGQTISFTGNGAGNNGTVNLAWSVLELPA